MGRKWTFAPTQPNSHAQRLLTATTGHTRKTPASQGETPKQPFALYGGLADDAPFRPEH